LSRVVVAAHGRALCRQKSILHVSHCRDMSIVLLVVYVLGFRIGELMNLF